MALYIGLMSGTSLDGVDGVLVELVGAARPPSVLAFHHLDFPAQLRAELLALNGVGDDELHRAALAGNALAREYASASAALLARGGVHANDVRAIGAHGQTVRHRPGEFDGTGYTLQLLNGALLAERSGIDVVCDLRSRDVAAGGQGAPLVPAFHAAAFASPGRSTAVLNLGGIANLSLLAADGGVSGFDCGPANALLDGWCQRHLGRPFDEDGHWAAGGQVDPTLLDSLLAESYFGRPPPKSTGRDLFHMRWLDAHLASHPGRVPQDVQATLAALTVKSAAAALRQHAPRTERLLVCGGGALNSHLMRSLAAELPGTSVSRTDAQGWPAQQVEAAAFAWLADRFLSREPGNRVEVTGAAGPRVLGALYPAR